MKPNGSPQPSTEPAINSLFHEFELAGGAIVSVRVNQIMAVQEKYVNNERVTEIILIGGIGIRANATLEDVKRIIDRHSRIVWVRPPLSGKAVDS